MLAKAGLAPADMTRWAQEVLNHSLTAVELENSIAQGKVMKALRAGAKSGGLVTIEGFRQSFETWFSRVEKVEPVEKWNADRKREVLEELRPSMELGVRLARELNIDI